MSRLVTCAGGRELCCAVLAVTCAGGRELCWLRWVMCPSSTAGVLGAWDIVGHANLTTQGPSDTFTFKKFWKGAERMPGFGCGRLPFSGGVVGGDNR